MTQPAEHSIPQHVLDKIPDLVAKLGTLGSEGLENKDPNALTYGSACGVISILAEALGIDH